MTVQYNSPNVVKVPLINFFERLAQSCAASALLNTPVCRGRDIINVGGILKKEAPIVVVRIVEKKTAKNRNNGRTTHRMTYPSSADM